MMVRTYKIRTIFVFLSFCLLYFIILFNLWLVQIMQKNYFVQLGQRQHELTITTPPPRAEIFDRTGTRALATNKDSISAFILPKQLEEPQKLKAFLKKHFPAALERMMTHKDSYFLYVKRRLTPEDIKTIERSNIKDIKLLNEPSRYYPIDAAAPIVGVTDIDNNGLFGIELACNEHLAGTPTTYCLEKDCRNYYFKKDVKVSGKSGKSLKLTIDSNLQFLTHEELHDTLTRFNAKEAGAIVMDPDTGEILAMVTIPSFDPNQLTHLDIEKTKNRCIAEAYELGSVIKVCAAMAALEEGVVTPDELIDCKNTMSTYLDGRHINTWKAHGVIPFEQVVAQSNNIGIAQVALRVGPALYDYYTKLGFGQKTNLGLPGEHKGFVNHPNNWSRQSIISLSYGYEISATLLQLARAFSLIANNGHLVTPKIILDGKPVQKTGPVYSQITIDNMKNILEKTTTEGTARKAAIQGYRVMSKTGTANILEHGHYNANRNIYTCAGIVQKGSYQRVIVAFVKEAAQKDLYASTVAAPLFEHIAEKTLINDKVV